MCVFPPHRHPSPSLMFDFVATYGVLLDFNKGGSGMHAAIVFVDAYYPQSTWQR